MIAKRESLKAVHGKPMRNIYIEALTTVDLLGCRFILRLCLILLSRTFGDDQLVTALMDNARAH